MYILRQNNSKTIIFFCTSRENPKYTFYIFIPIEVFFLHDAEKLEKNYFNFSFFTISVFYNYFFSWRSYWWLSFWKFGHYVRCRPYVFRLCFIFGQFICNPSGFEKIHSKIYLWIIQSRSFRSFDYCDDYLVCYRSFIISGMSQVCIDA